MKKLIGLFILSFFLLGISNVKASTIVDTKQVSEGSIQVGLTFDTGYVGGIHITIPVSGDVEFASIEWDSSLSNQYTRRYAHQNNIVSIWITTGDSAKNLLNKDRYLKIGVLHFKNKTENEKIYKLHFGTLQIVDTSYQSITIDDVILNENQYTLSPTKTDLPSTPDLPPDDLGWENPNPDDSTSVDQNPIKPDDSNRNEDILFPDDENSNDENNNSNEINSSEEEKNTSKEETDQKNESSKNEDIQESEIKKKPNYFLIGLGVVGGFALIMFVIYVEKINKL